MSIKELEACLERIIRLRRNHRKDPKDRYSLAYFRNRIDLLTEEWSLAKSLYPKARAEVTEPDSLKIFQSQFEQCEEYFYELQDTFATQLDLYTRNEKACSAAPKSEPDRVGIKLKTIEVPQFSGRLEDWTSLKDLFESLIHKNGSLSDTERFHYLKSSLISEAAHLLKHLNCVGENYRTAWEIVVKRYQNKRSLVNSYLRRMFQHPHMEASAKSLERVVNTIQESVLTLKSLEQPVEYWNAILVYIVEIKMDNETRALWENEIKASTGVPEWEMLREFLMQRLHVLEVTTKQKVVKSDANKFKTNIASNKDHQSIQRCGICHQGSHNFYQCKTFTDANIPQRRAYVKRHSACFNCLRPGHGVSKCKVNSTCKKCGAKHNTLLHDDEVFKTKTQEADSEKNIEVRQSSMAVSANASNVMSTTLIPTARVNLFANGRTVSVTALIDQGSQQNFITEGIAKRLTARVRPTNIQIIGVGEKTVKPRGCTTVMVRSIYDSTSYMEMEVLIMNSITGCLPNVTIQEGDWPCIDGLQLADPTYNKPSKIDCLIGARQFPMLMLPGLRQDKLTTPIAQQTIFGWVLSGPVVANNCNRKIVATVSTEAINLSDMLKAFWEVEELPPAKRQSTQEEIECEEHFHETYKRDSDGKFIVELPLKQSPSILGDSRKQAEERFKALERRFQRDPYFKTTYQMVMNEYLSEKHMELVPESDKDSITYYMSHHAVIKISSPTTKTRVVFDASARTTAGHSFNSIQKTGPVLQDDLFTLLLSWRQYRYVVTADIKAMYRQIWINKKQQNLQRILWRDSPEKPIQEFRLKTVIFGTTAAPYLAVKTIKQLADIEGNRFPLGSQIVQGHLYVDDLLTGASSIETCIQIRNEIIELLNSGGFQIRKWSSNQPQILQDLPDNLVDLSVRDSWLQGTDAHIKTLGIMWDPKRDVFRFNSSALRIGERITKRRMASEIAKLFDPLGWISPVIIIGKIFLQRLWLQQSDWDEEVSIDLQNDWRKFVRGTQQIISIEIPRYIGLTEQPQEIQLHGFCDASERAFAAMPLKGHIRSVNKDNISSYLVTSKSKVAPLKRISLPRLELCGATLLGRLLQKIVSISKLNHCPVYAWTDSTIVLSWIQQPPHKWKTYVANRISEIHEHHFISKWCYVPSKENPADMATRGLNAAQLSANETWWTGPCWLVKSVEHWPRPKLNADTTLEAVSLVQLLQLIYFIDSHP